MDSPTHVLLGATVGTALLRERAGRAGVLLFTAASFLPDLDQPFIMDRLAYVALHRSFTHCLVALPAMALLLALAAKALRAPPRFATLYAIALFGLMVAVGFDVLTWWGTQLFWPFSRARVGLGVIFIVDVWLTAIVLTPLVAAAILKLARRPVPLRMFRVAAALVPVWLLACLAARTAAGAGTGADDILPQPFTPLRHMLVFDEGARIRLEFVDLLHGREPREVAVFPKNAGGKADFTDATPEGRLFLWFHRWPVREVRDLAGGRTEIVYRDLAYEMRPALRRAPPFSYRFMLEGDRIVERGFVP